MKPTIVYRTLRKISDLVLDEFYSEVYVEGRENIPSHVPVIIAATHHNELIDIATLTATSPHRRHVSFWAKSSLFINPVSRAILTSAASIPVKRNPNNNENVSQADRVDLFHETSAMLATGGTIGVFPEGTSYTEPRIVQIKEGAAWAAVKYVQWKNKETAGEGQKTNLLIVPVGIAYTDKSRYLSRISVRYGKPIEVDSFAERILSSQRGEASRVVKEIMAEIESQMFKLTINSPDWDTLYAARAARDILWKELPLQKFVEISQTFVNMFTPQKTLTLSQPQAHAKTCLIKYTALLHYTGIDHPSLATLYPPPTLVSTTLKPDTLPSTKVAFLVFLTQLLTTALHPRAIFFLPPLLAHIPAYVLARLSVQLLATPGEEEGEAQFKAVFGGLGMGLSYTGVSLGLMTWLAKSSKGIVNPRDPIAGIVREALNYPHVAWVLDKVGPLTTGGDKGPASLLKCILCLIGLTYGTASILSRWHRMLVVENYRQFKRLVASFKIFVGLLSPRSSDVPPDELELYSHPPPPPVNPFIKRRVTGSSTSVSSNSSLASPHVDMAPTEAQKTKTVAYRRLIRHLLVAKLEATTALATLGTPTQ